MFNFESYACWNKVEKSVVVGTRLVSFEWSAARFKQPYLLLQASERVIVFSVVMIPLEGHLSSRVAITGFGPDIIHQWVYFERLELSYSMCRWSEVNVRWSQLRFWGYGSSTIQDHRTNSHPLQIIEMIIVHKRQWGDASTCRTIRDCWLFRERHSIASELFSGCIAANFVTTKRLIG